MSLQDRVYVLTGGASGIGLATAKRLLQHSATVHIIDLASEPPEFGDHLGKAWCYPSVDVSSREQMSEAFQQIRKRSPVLTGLVSCAGVYGDSPLAADEEADRAAKRIMDVNLWGTWNAGTEFLISVAEGSTGKPGRKENLFPPLCIVNVASMAAVRGIPGISAYAASKHAVLGLTRCWSQEYGSWGVRVNAVGPGVIRTSISGNSAQLAPGPYIPAIHREGEPEEVAGTIMFLLSDLSSYISGQLIEVNGGWA